MLRSFLGLPLSKIARKDHPSPVNIPSFAYSPKEAESLVVRVRFLQDIDEPCRRLMAATNAYCM